MNKNAATPILAQERSIVDKAARKVAEAAVDWADACTARDAGAGGSSEYLRAREVLLRATVREYRALTESQEVEAGSRELYKAQKKVVAALVEERGVLLAALKAVEWYRTVYGDESECPWCEGLERLGHEEGCIRQSALEVARSK